MARPLAWRSFVGAGVLVIAGAAALWLGRSAAKEPQRCPARAVALGPRCCGIGQELVDGRCRGEPVSCPEGMRRARAGCVADRRRIAVAAGRLAIAPGDWETRDRRGYDAEVDAFAIDSHEVTEGDWSACVARGRCLPRVVSGEPGRAMVGITQRQASAYCAVVGGALPTVEQWLLAASRDSGRRYPWGQTGAVCRRASFGLADGPCGRGGDGPELAGMRPSGATPDGIHDLAGNVAEWLADGSVAGGSWRTVAAQELRVWAQAAPRAEHADDIGFRCAYAGEDRHNEADP